MDLAYIIWMPHYFNNDHLQAQHQYYYSQPLEWRETIEAQRLMNELYKGAREIVKGVIFTHKFHKKKHYYSVDELEVFGLEGVMSALPRFNPHRKKENGKQSDLFTWMSKCAYHSINFACIKEYYHLSNNITSLDTEDKLDLHDSSSNWIFVKDDKARDKIVDFLLSRFQKRKREIYRPYVYAFLNFYYRNPDSVKPSNVFIHRHMRHELGLPTHCGLKKEGKLPKNAYLHTYQSKITKQIVYTTLKYKSYLLQLADYC